MSEKYKTVDKEMGYFLTLTVVDWIYIFIQKNHKMKIVEALKFCQENKGLEIFGYCLMSNHLHLSARAGGKQNLSEIIRDFKQFTSKGIIRQIKEEPETKKGRLLEQFELAGRGKKRIKKYKFWQDGNHAKLIFSPEVFYQKLEYIHNNPVKAGLVKNPEDYLFSSTRNYAGLTSYLDIIMETPGLKTS